MIEKTASNPTVAARVKAARAREDEWLAKNLEAEKTSKRAATADAIETMDASTSSSSSSTKRKPEDQ